MNPKPRTMTRGKRWALGWGLFFLAVLIAPELVGDATAPVAVPLDPPSAAHWLGTTGQGQDVLAQTIAGARPTLVVGLVAGVLVVAVGALIGAVAGYAGGRVDRVLELFLNVGLVLPALPLMVILAAHLPPGPTTIIVVLVATGWAWTARVIRAEARSLRQRDFVLAAEVAGEPAWRIVVVEMLPNLAPLLGSCVIGATIYAIGAQVGLEFLGLGDVSAVTWGTSLYWAANDGALLTGSWWTFVPAGVGLALTGFALTRAGAALDEAMSPRLRRPAAYLAATRGQAGAASGAVTPVLRGRGGAA